MTAREQAGVIAEAVRASLLVARDRGLTLEQAIELGIDKAIGNNAAQALQMEES